MPPQQREITKIIFREIFVLVLAGIGIAALAGYIPARRASRTDLMAALRYE